MLTLFTTAKPFAGHASIIQRNALKSWTLLHPNIEVILFGDDEGAADVCAQLGLRHQPYVLRDEIGLKRIDYYFDRAQQIARHDVLCYANCDIILTSDFLSAVKRVREAHRQFLMVGRRWDVDVSEGLNFSDPQWQRDIQMRGRCNGRQRPAQWIDYFAFSKGLYLRKIPAFVVGRVSWDNWLIWYAQSAGASVVDASEVVTAIHQNHDYSYHPKGQEGVWNDPQSRRNLELAGGYTHLRTIANARYVLTHSGLIPNRWHKLNYYRWNLSRFAASLSSRTISAWQSRAWHPLLNATRRLRHAVGLRRT